MTKRTFFKSLMSMVATVALAPEIAFGRKLDTAQWRINPDWVNAEYELWIPSAYMGDVEFLTGKPYEDNEHL